MPPKTAFLCGILAATLFCQPAISDDLPEYLQRAVDRQKQNKMQIVQALLGNVAAMKKAGKHDEAKELKRAADGVRTGKRLWFDTLVGHVDGVGTIVVHSVHEGGRVKTEIQEIEQAKAVNVGGFASSLPWQSLVHVPAELVVKTSRALKPKDVVVVRWVDYRADRQTVIEVPQDEIEAAEKALRGK